MVDKDNCQSKIKRLRDINKLFESPLRTFKSKRGKTIVIFENGEEINVTNTELGLFAKRAILSLAMLIR